MLLTIGGSGLKSTRHWSTLPLQTRRACISVSVDRLARFDPALSGCWSKLKSLEMKMNAETQRNAEKRRENEASALL